MAKLLTFGGKSRFYNGGPLKGAAYVPSLQVQRTRKQSVNAGPGRAYRCKRERLCSIPCFPVRVAVVVAHAFTFVRGIVGPGPDIHC
jgi:hypothetical protein